MSFSSDVPLQSNQLPISIEFPPVNEEFDESLSLTYKRIVDSVNRKEGSLYQLQEQATFQQYFTVGNPQVNRNGYRMVVNFGTLPNTGPKSVAHGISFNSNFSTTRIYGSATDPTGLLYIPLPFASPTAANNIELYLDATNVNVITGSNRTNFTICTIVIEYLKN